MIQYQVMDDGILAAISGIGGLLIAKALVWLIEILFERRRVRLTRTETKNRF